MEPAQVAKNLGRATGWRLGMSDPADDVLDPMSDEFWELAYTEAGERCEARQEAIYKSRPCEDAYSKDLRQTEDDYHLEILAAWKAHRPNGPLGEEVVPRVVECALDHVSRIKNKTS